MGVSRENFRVKRRQSDVVEGQRRVRVFAEKAVGGLVKQVVQRLRRNTYVGRGERVGRLREGRMVSQGRWVCHGVRCAKTGLGAKQESKMKLLLRWACPTLHRLNGVRVETPAHSVDILLLLHAYDSQFEEVPRR